MKIIFGVQAYLVRGTIFALCIDNDVVLTSLTEGEREEVARHFPSHPFIARGNPIPTWLQVRVEHEVDLTSLVPFLRQSYENALLKSAQIRPH